MSESRLEVAKNIHRTDFGTWEDVSARFEDTKIETPMGTYVCYHDGTFSDMKNRLMWIQAPWGMTFNGKKFKGEPIKLNWDDARQLFGYGGRIGHEVGFLKPQFEQYGRKEYKRGSCKVEFSGYEDWRLPTAPELLNLSFYHHMQNTKLWDELFPAISNPYTTFWTANDMLSNEAWCFNDNGTATAFGAFKASEYPILFVRNL